MVIIFSIFPIEKIESDPKNGIKPKAYFQFWASQLLILGLGIWTIVKNFHGNNFNFGSISIIGMPLMIPLFTICYSPIDLNTPTQWCCCCKGFCHVTVTFMSIAITTFFCIVFITSIPSIILIYYLHPVQTLARLPFVINSILYINSLLALLLYQLERCCYKCTPKSELEDVKCCGSCCFSPLSKKRAEAHNEYYDREDCQEKRKWKQCILLVMQPIATTIVLLILILFIYVLSDLLNMDRSKFTEKNQVELLFTLVPSVALLFGSAYNLDFFFRDILKEKEGKDKEGKSKEPNESTHLLINTQQVQEESV